MSSIEPFETTALEALPLIVRSPIIIGKNALIVLHNTEINSQALLTSMLHMPNTVIETHNVEQMENVLERLDLKKEVLTVLNRPIITKSASIEAKLFKTLLIPAVK